MSETQQSKIYNSRDQYTLEVVQRLEKEKEALKHELWKYQSKPTGRIGSIFLIFGIILILISLISGSQIAAFIGISLSFWGGLFHFIKPTNYVKTQLLSSTTIFSLVNLKRIISSLDYKGKGIYLSTNFSNLSNEKLFIPNEYEETNIPQIEKFVGEKIFYDNPKGICLTPTGSDLANFFEEELGIEFSKSGMETLQEKLSKLFTEGLEIAQSFEMERVKNNIHLRISNSPYINMCSKIIELTNSSCHSIACPLCSSIACILARSTGKPVVISNSTISKDSKTLNVTFQIIGVVKKHPLVKQSISKYETTIYLPKKFKLISPNILGLVTFSVGSVILAFLGWLFLYDSLVWNKDMITILFSSRVGETIGLGIGLRVIHYVIIVLGLFIMSIIQLSRRKNKSLEE